MEEKKELIPLQHSNITQLTHKGVKGEWIVKTNITDIKLAELPSKFTEEEVFKVVKFARKFEIEAFNIGINFEKEKSQKLIKEITDKFNNQITIAREENERLATKLMKLIGEQEDN